MKRGVQIETGPTWAFLRVPKEPQAVSSRSEVDASLTHSTPAVPVSAIHEMLLSFLNIFFIFSFSSISHFFLLLFSQFDLFFLLYNVFSFLSFFLFINLVFFSSIFLSLFSFMWYLNKFHKHNILSFFLSSTTLRNTNYIVPHTKYNVSIPDSQR